MKVVGYCDPLSVAPGESIRFMVSCQEPAFDAQVVRLAHGDLDPEGPGYRDEELDAGVNGTHAGRPQPLRLGSHAAVPDAARLAGLRSFSLRVAVFATAPGGGPQAIASKWSPGRGGFSLELDERGALSLRLAHGDSATQEIAGGPSLRPATWYRVGMAYDADRGTARLVQRPVVEWPHDHTAAVLEERVAAAPELDDGAPLVFAARGGTAAHFNGKLSAPALYERALTSAELGDERAPAEPLAVWQLGLEPASARIVDTGPHGLHGVTVNMPMRGATGPAWRGREMHHLRAPEEYDAIHFHDDDLEDAGWEPACEWRVPANLRSGVYALRLRAGESEDHVPFYVRPAPGAERAPIAFLVPTFSHLAYADEQYMFDPVLQEALGVDIEEVLERATPYEQEHYRFAYGHGLLSLYDVHRDGSGTCYASRRRPLVNMRPKYNWPALAFEAPHQFNGDLYLVDWLEQKGFAHDVVADDDLHREGLELLEPYRVVITGSHPEYWTEPMLDALQRYLDGGGRLMYLGGNGFYWVTSVDPERPHVIEIRRGAAGSRKWQAAPGEYHHSTTGEMGGLWRHRNRVPQRMVGVGFTGQGYDRSSPYRRLPDSHHPRAAFVFEGVESEVIGDFGLHLGGAAGYEMDRWDPELGSPPGSLRLAASFGHSDSYQHAVEEVLESDSLQGATVCPLVRADMVLAEYPYGGAVFSVGSISWTGSLSHAGYDNDVSRITENVLRRFLVDAPLSEDA